MKNREFRYIAKIHTDFPAKFGVPRQSGLVKELEARIVFEPDYRNPQAVLGIEEYSHLWLIWDFSQVEQKEKFQATVFPPRLGGKEKRGVFATRSPFRPNPLGLSCVRLERVEYDPKLGPVLYVKGADLMDQTPILDIKPYLPYADAYPDARGGFGQEHSKDLVEVIFPEELLELVPAKKREALLGVLRQDPRAAYQKQPDYIYGMAFANLDVRFVMQDGKLVVKGVENRMEENYENIK